MDKLQLVRAQVFELSQDKEKWQNPVGQATAELLKRIVLDQNAKRVLEIGTSAGYSALWIAEALRETGGHLWTIESNQERHDIAQQNFQDAGVADEVTLVKGHAPEDLNLVKGPFELAFFDATKRETTSFFEYVWPLMTHGGKIIVDNINTHPEKFEPFLTYLEDNHYKYEKLEIDAGLIILTRD